MLYVSRDMMVIAQNMKYLNAAYGGVMKNLLHDRLLLPYLLMISMKNWGKSSRDPQVLVTVSTMSDDGLECQYREILEIEWQFYSNKGWLLCCSF